jgi:hypothetical protein
VFFYQSGDATVSPSDLTIDDLHLVLCVASGATGRALLTALAADDHVRAAWSCVWSPDASGLLAALRHKIRERFGVDLRLGLLRARDWLCAGPGVLPNNPGPLTPGEAMGVKLTDLLAALDAEAVGRPATIIWHGGQRYGVAGGDPVSVTDAENCCLRAFLGDPPKSPPMPTMALRELRLRSGIDDASRTLKKLRTKYGGTFAGAIRVPEGRGNGGYFVRILSCK